MSVKNLIAGPPEIRREEIHYNPSTDLLGGGAYGDVFKAQVSGIPVALKVPKKQEWSSPEELAAFKEEVAILKSIFHTNVVLFLGACTATGNVMIVLEMMRTDLDKVLHEPENLPPDIQKFMPLTLAKKLKLAHDTVLGIAWLHNISNVVHRDLKPANLLLDENFRVKVSDFGFSQFFHPAKKHISSKEPVKGTKLYLAPEVWHSTPASTASDVYAFGLILWELYTEEELFSQYSDVDPFYREVIVGGVRPAIPPYVPNPRAPANTPAMPTLPSLADLMRRCWDPRPEVRPSISQVLVQLESIMIESVVAAPSGRAFWKKHFGSTSGANSGLQLMVSWEAFAAAVSAETGVPTTAFPHIEKLACETGGVEATRFDLLQKWFGDFFVTGKTFILAEMNNLAAQDWFNGWVQATEAELWLDKRPSGTFLVRLSTNSPTQNPVTISRRQVNAAGVVETHHRRATRVSYDHVQGRYAYQIAQPKAATIMHPDLVSLVEELIANHELTTPCPFCPFGLNYS